MTSSAAAMTTRKPFVGGNWKCNGTLASTATLVDGLLQGKLGNTIDCVVAPSWLHIPAMQARLGYGIGPSSNIEVAAQNCSATADGAFTGEVSAEMIHNAKLPWVILGHSERRHKYGEDDATVARKVERALAVGLKVIACIGETLEERKADKTMAVLERQLKAIAGSVGDKWADVVIAYEPVWAIGTGVVATPQQAQAVHKQLRDVLGKSVGGAVRIIYGGSVKPNNCRELIALEDVDGFLVGGASLKSEDFLDICNAAGAAAAK